MLPGFRQLSFGALEDDCPNSRELNTIRKATNGDLIFEIHMTFDKVSVQELTRIAETSLLLHCCFLQQQQNNSISPSKCIYSYGLHSYFLVTVRCKKVMFRPA